MIANDLLKNQQGGMYFAAENSSIKQCVAEMVEKHVGALIVLDQNRNLQGIISERDILRLINEDENCKFVHTAVKDVMTPKAKLISAQTTEGLADVMDKMNRYSIRHIVILEGERYVGLGSIRDVVRMLLDGALAENKQLMDYVYNSSL